MTSKYKVGDLARITRETGYPGCGLGDIVTICVVRSNGGNLGLDTGRFVNGHDCGGTCPKGQGWWIGPFFVEPVGYEYTPTQDGDRDDDI